MRKKERIYNVYKIVKNIHYCCVLTSMCFPINRSIIILNRNSKNQGNKSEEKEGKRISSSNCNTDK